MKAWSERPDHLANLLNPAFGGFLVHSAIDSYAKTRSEGIPFALVFLVMPLVLHMNTRDSLPSNIRTTLISWLEDHPEARVDLDIRVRNLVPFTREAIIFLMQRGLVQVDQEGRLVTMGSGFVGSQAAVNRVARATPEVGACTNKSQFVGRWFALSGDAATVLALFGLRP